MRVFDYPVQNRRLPDGNWVVDVLNNGYGDIVPLIKPGDEWVYGPLEGSLEPELATSLVALLRSATASAESCWFGIWDGFGCLDKVDRRTASITTANRRWHLFRGPLDHLALSFNTSFQHQTANLVWPEDRSWCLSTEIDAETTFVGGGDELIDLILKATDLETRKTFAENPMMRFGSMLQPVVDKPTDVHLKPAIESRESRFPPTSEVDEEIVAWIGSMQIPRALRVWNRIRDAFRAPFGKGAIVVFRTSKKD